MVVLFGGFDGTNGLNDTWLWDGSNWNQKSLATNPPARTGPAIAADGHGEVVLFGGAGNPFFDDTWLWDGSSWTQASPGTSPSARVSAGMATEQGRQDRALRWLPSQAPALPTTPGSSACPSTPRRPRSPCQATKACPLQVLRGQPWRFRCPRATR